MKNWTRSAGIMLVGVMAAVAMAQELTVYLDSKEVMFPDVKPVRMNGRVMVPMRAVLEDMGCMVYWRPDTQTVHVHKLDTDVDMKLNSTTVMVNGMSKTIDAPATMTNGRVLVPLRFLSESFGAKVDWDEGNQVVNITSTEPTTVIPR